MIEAAVERTTTRMEAYLGGEEPDRHAPQADPQGHAGAGVFVPVLCGSAFKNKGVQPLLTRLIDLSASPIDVPKRLMGVKPGAPMSRWSVNHLTTKPFAGLAFKIMNDPFVGSLTFMPHLFRRLKKGTHVLNTVKGKRERVGRMLEMHSNNREEIDEAHAGDIVAIGRSEGHDYRRHALRSGRVRLFSSVWTFPDPVIEVAVEPKTKADQEKMGIALAASGRRRPVLPGLHRCRTGQTLSSGMGELHLDILVDRMKREFKVDANVGAPQVAYRETITQKPISTTRTRSRPAVRASSRASRCS